jgi:hypothetical protein
MIIIPPPCRALLAHGLVHNVTNHHTPMASAGHLVQPLLAEQQNAINFASKYCLVLATDVAGPVRMRQGMFCSVQQVERKLSLRVTDTFLGSVWCQGRLQVANISQCCCCLRCALLFSSFRAFFGVFLGERCLLGQSCCCGRDLRIHSSCGEG